MVKKFTRNDHVLNAVVHHRRLFPKKNSFSYRTFYFNLNMTKLYDSASSWLFGRNQKGLMSFNEKDHGARDGKSSRAWAQAIFDQHNIQYDTVRLITMPRICGYVFNPVSFWVSCKSQQATSVLCEVNNTFGETHSYLCKPEDGRVVSKHEWFEAEKLFHVSPFLDREGHYKFKFDLESDHKKILIHYYKQGKPQLITSVEGFEVEMTKRTLVKAFLSVPLMTLKVMCLIHYQALKLWMKRVGYRPKPAQLDKKLSVAEQNITKN